MSYIDFGSPEEDDQEQNAAIPVISAQARGIMKPPSIVHVAPQAYIPSAPQYIQSTYTITPLNQMQVLHGGDYGEIVTVLGGELLISGHEK